MKGCGCDARPAAAPSPGGACSSGSLAALGIVLPLFTLAIGACVGVCVERKSSKSSKQLHPEEIALT